MRGMKMDWHSSNQKHDMEIEGYENVEKSKKTIALNFQLLVLAFTLYL
jgi:hypothetical protein